MYAFASFPRFSTLFLIAFAALCNLAMPAAAQDQVRVTGILVTGIVSEQQPTVVELADVDVSLQSDGTVVTSGKTSLDGSFSLMADAGNRYQLCWEFQGVSGCRRVVASDMLESSGKLRSLGKSDTLIAMGYVPLSLKPPLVYGTVLTGDARPCWVQDAFFALDVKTELRAAGQSTIANTQGEYVLLPKADTFLLRAKCEKALVDRTVTVSNAPLRIDLALPNRAPRITSIAATDGNDFAVTAVPSDRLKVVTTNRDLDGHTVEYLWKLASDGDGAISGSTSETEEWEISSAPGQKTVYVTARDGFGGFAFRRFDMEAGSQEILASGRVIDASSGTPVVGATVGFGGSTAKTDGNGWFSIKQPPNADKRYVLNIEHPNFAMISRIIDRSARGETYELIRAHVFTFPSDRDMTLEDTRSAGICGDDAFGETRKLKRLAPRRYLGSAMQTAEVRGRDEDAGEERRAETEQQPRSVAIKLAFRRVPGLVTDDVMAELHRFSDPFSTLRRDPKQPRETETRSAKAAILQYLRDQQECDRRGIQIRLKANSFAHEDGTLFSGVVRASIATLNPAIRSIPGDYQAITASGDRAELLSFGALYAEFTDMTGQKLQLRRGVQAEVRTPVSSYQSSSAQQKIAQWSYDTKSGFWREEGLGTLQATGDGPRYVGTTSHFSSLNMDVSGSDPAVSTCVRFEVGSDFAAWSNLTIRAYVSYNGDSVQVKETPLDNQQYHAIFRIPYGNGFPPNTLRLELRGTSSGTDVVLLDDIINTDARPKMTGTDLWPDYPYADCGDPILLTAAPGVVPPYGDIDGFGRPAFLVGPYGSFNPADGGQQAINYYNSIDPAGDKDELGKWWVENGFGADGLGQGDPSYVNRAYLNHNDLGFGRDMHCRDNFPDAGDLSCYVTNYGLPDQDPGNADAAETTDANLRGATVTMEYDAQSINPDEAVQFYVFGGGESPAPRIAFADLDGLGPKPVPFLCMVCHGGGPSLNANDRVEHARFREFDLPSFRYSSGRSWDFGETSLSNAELDDYAALNQKVHDAHTGTPIGDLIDNWYTGPFSGAPQEPQVPSGWATEENVYHEVYAKACRTCHIARDGGFALVFDSSAQLGGTAYVVCDIGDVGVRRMPNASVTYRNFWADTNSVLLYETLTGQPAGSCDD